MTRRRIGYAVWLMLAACLYFFENNTGTRAVLLCSVLVPFIRPLRSAFFFRNKTGKETESPTIHSFFRTEEDEPGDIRLYIPGDPVRRIHWKLSAKRDELLVRTTARGPETTEEKEIIPPENKRKKRKYSAAAPAAGAVVCALLLLIIPEARYGAQALCNRLFAASEAVNRYAYRHFIVPENQDVIPAAFLLLCILILVAVMAFILHNQTAVMGIMAACTLFQVYFGLAFPAWINIPLYGVLGLQMLKRPVHRRGVISCCVLFLLVSAAVLLLLPGVDAATETASEKVRDLLAETAGQTEETVTEVPDEETETRHVHTRAMENGNGEAQTEREFRLVTTEEEQISMPHRINWMKTILLMLLAVVLVTLPFAPFLLLNARKKKAQERRKAFDSENVSEAVQAIFRQVILWLEATRCGAGNLLFRDWCSRFPDELPEDYTEHFAGCVTDYEEAVYSNHEMPEEKRQHAMELLRETETALRKAANRKQRFYLKYWMGLYE